MHKKEPMTVTKRGAKERLVFKLSNNKNQKIYIEISLLSKYEYNRRPEE